MPVLGRRIELKAGRATNRHSQGVVLVDDRDYAHIEKFIDSICCVEVLRAIRNVVPSEQNLRYWLL